MNLDTGDRLSLLLGVALTIGYIAHIAILALRTER